ncbi:MAG: hypothetical protein LBW77_05970 [Verrucomicrobiota bacterium]|jgi:hypothetical protein|nr:hypothetical protein [Verrucomicrobiota bacterium]
MKTHSAIAVRPSLLLALLPLLICGCATLAPRPAPPPIPCAYRFKLLTRPEDQDRVENAIRAAAVGSVAKSGTVTYPEYRFHVAKLADLDTLLSKLMFEGAGGRQALNLRAAGIDFSFDSTDVSASAALTVTFQVKPGSRLYYKNPGGVETDITAKVDKNGKVAFPAAIKEGQKYIYARAVKDNVTRHIRINIFTNGVEDISPRDY